MLLLPLESSLSRDGTRCAGRVSLRFGLVIDRLFPRIVFGFNREGRAPDDLLPFSIVGGCDIRMFSWWLQYYWSIQSNGWRKQPRLWQAKYGDRFALDEERNEDVCSKVVLIDGGDNV